MLEFSVRAQLIQKDLQAKGIPEHKILEILKVLGEVHQITSYAKEGKVAPCLRQTAPLPVEQDTYAVRHARVMASIVERAINLASTPSGPTRFLFQRRIGRAIWALTAGVLKYALRWGITLALSMEKESNWIPICSDGTYSHLGAELSSPLKLGVDTPNECGALKALGVVPHKKLAAGELQGVETLRVDAPKASEVVPLRELVAKVPREVETSKSGALKVLGVVPQKKLATKELQEAETSRSDAPKALGVVPQNKLVASMLQRIETPRNDAPKASEVVPQRELVAELPQEVKTSKIGALKASEVVPLAPPCKNFLFFKNKNIYTPKFVEYYKNFSFCGPFESPQFYKEPIGPLHFGATVLAQHSLNHDCDLFLSSLHDSAGILFSSTMYQHSLGCWPKNIENKVLPDYSKGNTFCGFEQPPLPILDREFQALNSALDALAEAPVLKWASGSYTFSYTPRFIRGEENYFLPSNWKGKRNISKEILSSQIFVDDWGQRLFKRSYHFVTCKCRECLPRCTSNIHGWMCSTCVLYAHDCWVCPIEALVSVGEQDQRDRRLFELLAEVESVPNTPSNQYGKSPPAEIENGGASKGFGMLFAAVAKKHDRGPTTLSVNAIAMALAAPAFACIHSGSDRVEQETREDLADRAHNEQAEHGAPTINATIANLRKRVRKKGKKTLEFGEGRLGDKNTKIMEEDVFKHVAHGGFADKALSYLGRNTGGLLTQQTFPTKDQDVCLPSNILECVYTPLPQFSERQLRHLLDKQEMKSSGITAIDLAIQSHVGEATPMTGFCTIMDGNNGDPNLAALSGSKFDLGRDRCQVITLPLVNINLNELAKQVNEENKTRLYLATLFNNSCGFYSGKCIFQYGTSQLLEHRPDAYTNQTLCKDEWLDIEQRNQKKGCRILKGFNVEQHVAQDYNQKLLPYDERAILKCRPRPDLNNSYAFSAGGVVKNYEPSRLEKFCSVRFLNEQAEGSRKPSQFDGLGYVTGHSKGPQLADIDNSFVDNLVRDAPRHATTCSDMDNPYEIAICETFNVSKDAKEGTHIGTINFYSAIVRQHKMPYQKWLGLGLIEPEIMLNLYCGGNPFMGTTIGIVHDFYNRVDIPGVLGGKLPRIIGNCLPQTLHPMADGGFGSYKVNVSQYLGHSLFVSAKSFADPRFHLYIYDDNTTEASAEWRCTIEILVRRCAEKRENFNIPILSIPDNSLNSFINLDLHKGFGSIPLGKDPVIMPIGLDFASAREYSTGKTCLGTTQAIFRCFLGVGGTLEGRLIRTSTFMVSCNVRILIWYGLSLPRLQETGSIPHEDLDLSKSDGSFQLKIQSPYSRIANRSIDARLLVYPLGGPVAAKGCNAPFSFAIYIRGIHFDEPVQPLLFPDREYHWCQITGIRQGEQTLVLPNHVCDFSLKNLADVTLRANPLSAIFGSCGFFKGELTMIFRWSVAGKLADSGSSIYIARCYGTADSHEVLESWVSNVYKPDEIRIVLNVGDFSGANIPGNTTNPKQFPLIWLADGIAVGSIQCSVLLHSGFAFYGRSCLAIK
uniref:Polyprotein n=1 Tax=Logan nepovirus TaxID=3115782 RepID=A0AAT9JAW7_9SECO